MSEQGDKTCPLCAEEMDLTDQQLKPCKCGYEICVWCWHHIMDMAEKDDTEGRCPACRTPYDKEKIVGMAASCERMVAEINMERKYKSQKTKNKTCDGRKQLSTVRVIQRNLVYIVGLPLNLADEDLLQRREYFGQYGRVLKVSMSRTAAGSIQHFPNHTCSVYITYSKEDEAIRCIQAVHGFNLDGRSLRACFGTTKYCHAWLRNVACNNPDCLYLHEIGSQDDSFTKDEIISAYSRVQQITGVANNLQRRSGNVLPPPLDEYCSNSSASSGKPVAKNSSNQNLASIVKSSPPNGCSSRSVALPAAASWGVRSSNCLAPALSSACSDEPSKQKPNTLSCSLPSAVASTMHSSKSLVDMGKKILLNGETHTVQLNGKLDTLESVKVHNRRDTQTSASDAAVAVTSAGASAAISQTGHSLLYCTPTSVDTDRGSSYQPNIKSFNGNSCASDPDKAMDVAMKDNIQDLCSVMSSMGTEKQPRCEHNSILKANSPNVDSPIKSLGQGNVSSQQIHAEPCRESFISSADRKTVASVNGSGFSVKQCDAKIDSKCRVVPDARPEVDEDLLSFHHQRFNDTEVASNTAVQSSSHLLDGSRNHFSQSAESICFNSTYLLSDREACEGLPSHTSDVFPKYRGDPDSDACLNKIVGHSPLVLKEGKKEQIARFVHGEADVHSAATADLGENSIISNILSMDYDAWNDSLTAPHNLARLLGESDKQHDSLKMSNAWKVQNSNQSRFSFARQEESNNKMFEVQPSFNAGRMNQSVDTSLVENGDLHFDRHGSAIPFSSRYAEESDNFFSGQPVLSASKLSGSRAQVSAPPGFSVPCRAPPGFLPYDKSDPAFDIATGNRLPDTSSLLRNPYQVPENVNMSSTADIEFIDPAILAVGKGRLPGGFNNPGIDMRSNVFPQLNAVENDARLSLLMQRSLSQQQNLGFSSVGDNFCSLNDSFGIPSRLMEQSQPSNLSPFSHMSVQQSRNALLSSNGQWEGWNEVHNGNNLGMVELLRNERLSFNKFYTGYEDPKFRMPNSGDLYNRTFGM